MPSRTKIIQEKIFLKMVGNKKSLESHFCILKGAFTPVVFGISLDIHRDLMSYPHPHTTMVQFTWNACAWGNSREAVIILVLRIPLRLTERVRSLAWIESRITEIPPEGKQRAFPQNRWVKPSVKLQRVSVTIDHLLVFVMAWCRQPPRHYPNQQEALVRAMMSLCYNESIILS